MLNERRHAACVLIVATVMATTLSETVHPHPPRPAEPASANRDTDAALIEFLQARLERQPDDTMSLSSLGAALLDRARASAEHHDYERAEEAFAHLSELDPQSTTALIGLSYSRLGQHEFTSALDAARAAAVVLPDESAVWALLGDIHLALGHVLEAEMHFRRLVAEELTMQSLSRMAMIHQLRGRDDEAVSTMQDALTAARLLDATPGEQAWCHTMLGEMAFERGRLDEAESQFRQALDLDRDAHHAEAQLAVVEARLGRAEAAHHRLEHLVESRTKPEYLIALGDVSRQLGRQDEAERWYRRAELDMLADLDAGDLAHSRELAEYWLEHNKDVDRAVRLALRELEEVRQDAGSFSTAAWAEHHAGHPDRAMELIGQALSRAPADPTIAWRAGVIYDASGRIGLARLLIRRALTLNPRMAPSMLDQTRRILGSEPETETETEGKSTAPAER